MNILFVFAHPDDEAFGPGGTIAKLARQGNTVKVFSLCNGARPGSEYVATPRQSAFKISCFRLGAKPVVGPFPDLTLTYRDTVSAIEDMVTSFEPEVVYTHNISDINADHRLVAEATLVACRPKHGCGVSKLLACEIHSSTSWAFGQFQPAFQPNVWVDISETIDVKYKALAEYKTETYAYPDARSLDAMASLAQYRGTQVDFTYAEAFQLIFQRDL